jgi:arylformamidase
MGTPLHADYNPAAYSIEELDRQYNARAAVPDSADILARYGTLSAQVRADYPCDCNVPYGPHLDETVDVFPARQPDSPVFVFIHGGYWRALSKDDSAFMVPAFVPAGAAVVTVNYALAPQVSLADIVAQCRRAVAWVYRNIQRYGGDPNRIHVSGHSAGGQLTGMVLADGWQELHGVTQPLVKSASAVSGLFDLRPLVHTYINEWLSLDLPAARQASPLFAVPAAPCPLLVSWGSLETPEFQRQAQLYAQAWRAGQGQALEMALPGTNHFTAPLELARRDSPLTQAILRMMGLPG